LKHFIIILVSAFALGSVAVADDATFIIMQMDPNLYQSPLSIERGVAAIDYTSNRIGTCPTFRNHGDKTITDITFVMTVANAEGRRVWSYIAHRVGTFSPNVLIEGPAENGNTARQSQLDNCLHTDIAEGLNAHDFRTVTLHVQAVTYEDGSKWISPTVINTHASLPPGPLKIKPRGKPKKAPTAFGSVAGVITWQYNQFVGTKGDVDAGVVLIPNPMWRQFSEPTPTIYTSMCLGIEDPRMQKYGLRVGRADGFGNAQIDHVPVGRYRALMCSHNAARNFQASIEDYLVASVRDLFNNDDALYAFEQSMFKLQKFWIDDITVRKGEVTHFNHDFGNTYI